MKSTRRRLLSSVGTLGIAAVVGCVDAVPLVGDDAANDGNEDALDEWPGFQRTVANSGFVEDDAAPTSAPEVRWERSLSGGLGDQVAVVDASDGRLAIAVTEAGTVHALDAAAGEEVWSQSLDGASGQCPAVSQGIVVVGTDAGTLYGLDIGSGEPEWTTALPGPVAGPTIAGDTAYAGTAEDPHACAVDLATGEEQWAVGIAENAVDYPAVASGSVYVGAEWTAALQGHVYALDTDDGSEEWHYEGTRMQSPTTTEEFVLAPSLGVRYYSHSGRVRGQFGTGGHIIASPAIDGRTIVTGTTAGRITVHGLAGADGPDWSTEVGGRPTAPPAVTPAAVYATRAEDDVVALDRSNGEIRWTWNVDGDVVTGPTVADGGVFVGTDGGTLVSLEEA